MDRNREDARCTYQALQFGELEAILVSDEVVDDGDFVLDIDSKMVAFHNQLRWGKH